MSTFRHFAWNASRVIAHNGGIASRALYQAANLYRKAYNNLNYDMETNGEFNLMRKMEICSINTVFDVGANKGEYTQACLNNFARAKIHAFEIAPPTYRKLIANVKSDRVIFNSFGLSNKKGSLVLNYSPDDDGSSSLVAGSVIHHGEWEEIDVDVITGDDYCMQNNITAIDLLKVDVEGAEHLVFEGFSRTLSEENISAVQFEFGMVNIYSKFLLKDFYELFGRYGFIMGPVMPTGIDFRDYDTRDEDFQGPPNFFAVHKSRTDLIDVLRK